MGVNIETRVWRFMKKRAKKVRAKRAKARLARKRAAFRAANSRKAAAAKAAPKTPPAPRPSHRVSAKPSAAKHPVAAWRNMAADINAWRADGLTADRQARERSAAKIQQTAEEKAQKRADYQAAVDARREARKQRADARKVAAATRQQQTATKPTVIHTKTTRVASSRPAARPAMRPAPRPSAPAAQQTPSAVLCGARTDDGTPCRNPTTGGPCSAQHTPKAKPRVQVHRSTTTRGSGETGEQFLRRGRAEATAERAQTRGRA